MYGYVRSMSSLLIDVRVARDISNVLSLSIIIVKCFIIKYNNCFIIKYNNCKCIAWPQYAVVARHS